MEKLFDLSSLLKPAGKIWLTADYHFSHTSIIEHAYRPWTNIDKHDRHLIRNTAELVKKDDLLIINGDLTMKGPSNADQIEGLLNKIPGLEIDRVRNVGSREMDRAKTEININVEGSADENTIELIMRKMRGEINRQGGIR